MSEIFGVYSFGGRKKGRPEAYFSSKEKAQAFAEVKIRAIQAIFGEKAYSSEAYPTVDGVDLDPPNLHPYFIVTVNSKGLVSDKRVYFSVDFPDLAKALEVHQGYRAPGKDCFAGAGLTYTQARGVAIELWKEFLAIKEEKNQHRIEILQQRLQNAEAAQAEVHLQIPFIRLDAELPPPDDAWADVYEDDEMDEDDA